MNPVRTSNPFLKEAIDSHNKVREIKRGRDQELALKAVTAQALIAITIQLESLQNMLDKQWQLSKK